jgi:hypothetical protein
MWYVNVVLNYEIVLFWLTLWCQQTQDLESSI